MAQAATASYDFKRGDDFILDIAVQDLESTAAVAAKTALDADPNNPTLQAAYDAAIIVDITGWTIRSQVRRGKNLTEELTVAITDAANGLFRLSAGSAATALWKVDAHSCDIQFDQPAVARTSSETFTVNVCEDVTYDD